MKQNTQKMMKWVGGIMLLLSLSYAILYSAAASARNRGYKALERDGRPLKVEEILPAALPDEENAASFYQAAIMQLKMETGDEMGFFSELQKLVWEIDWGEVESDAERSVRELIAREEVQNAMALIREGSRKEGFRYDVNTTKGGIMSVPLIELTHLSELLNIHARLLAKEGNLDAAWAEIENSIRIANTIKNVPTMVPQLWRAALFFRSVYALESIAKVYPPSETSSRRIEELLEEFDDLNPLVLALDGERLLIGEWIFDPAQRKFREASVIGHASPFYVFMNRIFPPLRVKDHAIYLKMMNEYAKNATEAFVPEKENTIEKVPKIYILSGMITPDYFRSKNAFLSMQALSRTTRIGLRYLRTGEILSLPDPFCGEPIKFKETNGGFMVYSIGSNGRDDEGVLSPNKEESDIVLSFSTVAGN